MEDYQHQLARLQTDSDGYVRDLIARMRRGTTGECELVLFDQFGRIEQRLTLGAGADFGCCVLLQLWLGDVGGALGAAYACPGEFGGAEAETYLHQVYEIVHFSKSAKITAVQRVERLEVEPRSGQFVEFPLPVVGALLRAVLPAGDAWAASYAVNLLQASVRYREVELRPAAVVLRGHPLFSLVRDFVQFVCECAAF